MKIVLDTNLLVAGLLSPFGPPGEIVRMVSSGELELCFDARVLIEYREVLGRPRFRFDQDKIAALLDYIQYRGFTVAASPLDSNLPDPGDEPFLEILCSGPAEHLVTGNRVHLPAALCRGSSVLSPSEFLVTYRSSKESGKQHSK